MSPLRRRMIDDMQIRNLTPNTQRVYVAQVVLTQRQLSCGSGCRICQSLS
jgi:hypothetical protein